MRDAMPGRAHVPAHRKRCWKLRDGLLIEAGLRGDPRSGRGQRLDLNPPRKSGSLCPVTGCTVQEMACVRFGRANMAMAIR
jgi:hypothetical protein